MLGMLGSRMLSPPPLASDFTQGEQTGLPELAAVVPSTREKVGV